MDTEFKKTLCELLDITGHSQEERPVADYIHKFCKKHGIKTIEDQSGSRINGNAGNILACPKRAFPEKAEIMFCAHIDTVDLGAERKYRVSSKGLNACGTYPIGLDNRLGVALMLRLLSHKNENYICAFTTQEEIGMFGACELKVPSGVKAVFILDGSENPGHFITSTVGCITFKICLTGLSAHAGIHPNDGKNVIQMACKAIAKLKLGMPGKNESLNIGILNAGTRSNVIPSQAEIIGEVRANSLLKVNSVIKKVKGTFLFFAKKYGGTMTYSEVEMFRPYSHKPDSLIVKSMLSAIRKAGLEPVCGHYRGGSDANIFNNKGVPAINLSIGAYNPHSPKEYMVWRESEQAYKILECLLASKAC